MSISRKKKIRIKMFKTKGGKHPCPIGEHWVKRHPLKVVPSKKNPTGITIRRAHCASNPAGKGKINPKQIKTNCKRPYFSIRSETVLKVGLPVARD